MAIKKFRGRKILDGDSAGSYKKRSVARSAQARAMTMPMVVAWIGYQKFSRPIFLGGDSADPYRKPFACKLGPNPSDDHAHGGWMDWLSKTFGAENF